MDKRKGSITVEAALVIPIILILVIFLMMFILIQYEKAIVMTQTENLAYSIANHHNPKYVFNSTSDEEGLSSNPFADNTSRIVVDTNTNFDLYWRLFPNESYQKELFVLYNDLVNRMLLFSAEPLAQGSLPGKKKLSGTTENGHRLQITVDNQGIFNREIVVESKLSYRIPMGKAIGIEYYTTTFSSSVPIVDNAEFIRNYGLVKDMARSVPLIDSMFEGIKTIATSGSDENQNEEN